MNKYNADYFIEKFTNTSPPQWCERMLQNGNGQHCALGLAGCTSFEYDKERIEIKGHKFYRPNTEESEALFRLFITYLGKEVGYINNFMEAPYLYQNPRTRILVALSDIKRLEAADDIKVAEEMKNIIPLFEYKSEETVLIVKTP